MWWRKTTKAGEGRRRGRKIRKSLRGGGHVKIRASRRIPIVWGSRAEGSGERDSAAAAALAGLSLFSISVSRIRLFFFDGFGARGIGWTLISFSAKSDGFASFAIF
jgi:hypothetical protein